MLAYCKFHHHRNPEIKIEAVGMQYVNIPLGNIGFKTISEIVTLCNSLIMGVHAYKHIAPRLNRGFAILSAKGLNSLRKYATFRKKDD